MEGLLEEVTLKRHVQIHNGRQFVCYYDGCGKKSLCALCWEVEKWKQQAAVRIGSYSGWPTGAEFLEMLSPKSNTCNVEEGITIMDTLADNHCYNNSVKPESSISLLASVGYENASQRRLIQLPNTSLGINSSNLIGPQLSGAFLTSTTIAIRTSHFLMHLKMVIIHYPSLLMVVL